MRAAESAALNYKDDKADLEAELIGSGDDEAEIKKLALRDDYDRSKKFKDTFETISIWGLRLGALGLGAIAVSWLFHLIFPQFRWLDANQVSVLQNLLTGGILVSAFGEHFKKRIGQ